MSRKATDSGLIRERHARTGARAVTELPPTATEAPCIGRLGYGTFAYAYSFVFFTSTIVYALAAGSRNWKAAAAISPSASAAPTPSTPPSL